ncbi:MAG: TolC family protein [Bacteroidota bacterium]|nr:TolC family protein [Bacteroidota bacterium]
MKRYWRACLLVATLFSNAFCLKAQEFTLDSCRNMALRHNKTSLISEETLQAAISVRKATFTQFLPNFNAVGTYMYNSRGDEMSVLSEDATLPVGSIGADGKFTYTMDDIRTTEVTMLDGTTRTVPINSSGQPTTNPSEFVPNHVAYLPKSALTFDMTNIFVAGIGFTQPIFMGGKILELYKMSKYAENVAKIKYDNDNINVLIQVDEAFWRVVSLQKKKELAEEYNTLLQKTYEDIEQLFNEGLVTNAELLKVKVKLNESDMTLTKAENGLKLAKMYLNQICGLDFNYDYNLTYNENETSFDIVRNDSIKQDINQRPEAQLLEQSVNIAKSELNIARSRFLPNIVAQGNYVVSNPSLFNGFDKSFKGSFVIGVGVTVPIFHFGERIHTLNAAKHKLRIAQLTQQEGMEKMELQANMKQNSRNEAVKQNLIAKNNMEHAIENLRQAQLGFDEGVISTSDLMAAQTSWVSAKSELIDSDINLMLTDLYLNQSLGKIQSPVIKR